MRLFVSLRLWSLIPNQSQSSQPHECIYGVTQVPEGNAATPGRPTAGHSHHQLQRETLSDWQRVPDETQTV